MENLILTGEETPKQLAKLIFISFCLSGLLFQSYSMTKLNLWGQWIMKHIFQVGCPFCYQTNSISKVTNNNSLKKSKNANYY